MPNDFASFCRKPVTVTCGLAFLIIGLSAVPADARERHRRHGLVSAAKFDVRSREQRRPAPVVPQNIAAIVVDANSGRILYAKNENELRHPASVTKVMTLYLLFEQLDKGRLRLDSKIPVSARAAAQAPTKLGLAAGATIAVEDAIKAVVTRSANDIAVAIAEAIGGDEESFAALMTKTARGLGMTRTHFANASGLPDESQVTTAYDLTLLGRAIQDHFPRYYSYFATRTFVYRGAPIRNHNHLLERVEGMDGIKTGYTRASGFNLLAAVKRNGYRLVAAVLGGRNAGHRDRIMADLIEDRIGECSQIRTAGTIPLPSTGSSMVAVAKATPAPPPLPTRSERAEPPMPDQKLPFVPVSLKPGLTVDTTAVRAIGLAAPPDRPRPAYVAAAPRPRSDTTTFAPAETVPPQAALDGSTRLPTSMAAAETTVTPSSVRRPRAPVPAEDIVADVPLPAFPVDRSGDARRSASLRGDWTIQIAATNDLAKANDLLARAKQEGVSALADARPTTEKVQKGVETLYRARFVGLGAETAESACRTLKRSGFSCFATRD
jgi:D-alanyl-D-alanine carboxypeptidase